MRSARVTTASCSSITPRSVFPIDINSAARCSLASGGRCCHQGSLKRQPGKDAETGCQNVENGLLTVRTGSGTSMAVCDHVGDGGASDCASLYAIADVLRDFQVHHNLLRISRATMFRELRKARDVKMIEQAARRS